MLKIHCFHISLYRTFLLKEIKVHLKCHDHQTVLILDTSTSTGDTNFIDDTTITFSDKGS